MFYITNEGGVSVFLKRMSWHTHTNPTMQLSAKASQSGSRRVFMDTHWGERWSCGGLQRWMEISPLLVCMFVFVFMPSLKALPHAVVSGNPISHLVRNNDHSYVVFIFSAAGLKCKHVWPAAILLFMCVLQPLMHFNSRSFQMKQWLCWLLLTSNKGKVGIFRLYLPNYRHIRNMWLWSRKEMKSLSYLVKSTGASFHNQMYSNAVGSWTKWKVLNQLGWWQPMTNSRSLSWSAVLE